MTRLKSMVFCLCAGAFAAPVHAANIQFFDSNTNSAAQDDWYEALGLSRDYIVGLATQGESIIVPLNPLVPFASPSLAGVQLQTIEGLLTTSTVDCGPTGCVRHAVSPGGFNFVLGETFEYNHQPIPETTYSNGFELEFSAGINGLLVPLFHRGVGTHQYRITVDGGDENIFTLPEPDRDEYFAIASDEPFKKVRLNLVNPSENNAWTWLGVSDQGAAFMMSWDSTVYNPFLSPQFGYPDAPAPVPLPASFAMLGLGLGGLGLAARQKRRADA